MIPGGWISQRKAANTQNQSDLVKDNMDEKETIPEASNNQQDSVDSVEGPTTKP